MRTVQWSPSSVFSLGGENCCLWWPMGRRAKRKQPRPEVNDGDRDASFQRQALREVRCSAKPGPGPSTQTVSPESRWVVFRDFFPVVARCCCACRAHSSLFAGTSVRSTEVPPYICAPEAGTKGSAGTTGRAHPECALGRYNIAALVSSPLRVSIFTQTLRAFGFVREASLSCVRC